MTFQIMEETHYTLNKRTKKVQEKIQLNQN
jgi:hypothetical protein